MDENVAKAVGLMDACVEITLPQHTVFVGGKDDYQTIRARLVELEAENERLREWRKLVAEHNEGCEQACDMDRCGYRPYFENNGRRCSECPHFNTIDIPAHLSENGHE